MSKQTRIICDRCQKNIPKQYQYIELKIKPTSRPDDKVTEMDLCLDCWEDVRLKLYLNH